MDIETIFKYGAAFLGGGLAVKIFEWWTDKDKSQKQRRRDQITAWRNWLAAVPDNGGWAAGGKDERTILRSAEFQSLEAHLDKELLERLRKPHTMMIGFNFHREMSKKINDLEKTWGLL